jgi:hypothetical protein
MGLCSIGTRTSSLSETDHSVVGNQGKGASVSGAKSVAKRM